ncbi:DUF6111 family protein [Methylobacterium persicinum]|uniref:Uncharacterized protein n=1 Tax=Methylobacterium persicinum TaxID=374426 RepID=A0ABU0HIH5_9HYPH|nr:DUF6111 family protein [Methylobacterium persicinum]MDQ0442133.1 hypothetical protein [Methylobacterium persicinum]GJE38768.1 hypothetical protein KHHGKMAE_2843 [Methylobacterium persicinum]
MLRRAIEEFGLFLIPFGLFLLLLVVTGRNPLRLHHWGRQASRLVLAGLCVVIASLLYEGLFSERSARGYIPPHMENGQLVPGRFR